MGESLKNNALADILAPLSGDIRLSQLTFHVQRMEAIHQAAAGKVDAPHAHDYYTVLWVQKGEGQHLIDFNTYDFSDNAVFFVSPRQVHQVVPIGTPQGWVITFSRDFLAHNHISEDFIIEMNLFSHFDERPPIHLPPAVAHRQQQLFTQMVAASQEDSPYRMARLSAYLKLFLIDCHALCQLPDPNTDNGNNAAHLLRDFRKLITSHFRQLHQVQDYAQLMHLSAKYLNQIVRETIGKTAKELIQEKIILNAKRRLRYSELSIKEIAYELGFDDPLYFSSFFKNCTGSTPSAFRKG